MLAASIASMYRIFFSSNAIRIGMPNSMFANAFGDSPIHSIVYRPCTHVMIRRTVYSAIFFSTFKCSMRMEFCPILFFVFQ